MAGSGRQGWRPDFVQEGGRLVDTIARETRSTFAFVARLTYYLHMQVQVPFKDLFEDLKSKGPVSRAFYNTAYWSIRIMVVLLAIAAASGAIRLIHDWVTRPAFKYAGGIVNQVPDTDTALLAPLLQSFASVALFAVILWVLKIWLRDPIEEKIANLERTIQDTTGERDQPSS